MNTKLRKGIFWGGIIAAMILVLNGIHFLVGSFTAIVAGPHWHRQRGMVPHDGFGPHHMMGYHHHHRFSWMWLLFFLILTIVVLALTVKWVRRKSNTSSMQQFIDTSLMSSHRTLSNQNSHILDQWEKNILNNKENK
ncbi:hypothetical protein [Bacillus sp. S/N-304-OC-R1]|uniref:hypothetical protein n=1 Tax=Bacillus sp. S/N-304-OC-R1 TaxID=2758034 RepID=UPI001C8E9A67|nr:hypothetical protein [Bacillus sp. S/N-304-OC-R1]MBY0122025.1 hypothetical protein [Bacillus sp. S/N-304-OC-R1]